METKFTPGPWRSEHSKPMNGFRIFNDDGSPLGHVVASMRNGNEADANLMAAAPDMYEALTALLKDLEERAEIYSDGTKVLFCGNGVLFKADEALAKARGE